MNPTAGSVYPAFGECWEVFSRSIVFTSLLVLLSAGAAFGGTFTNKASLVCSGDPIAGNATFTVSCWLKLSIPSDGVVSEDMTVLVNQSSLADTSHYPFLIRFNKSNGNLEFVVQRDNGHLCRNAR